MKLTPLNNSNRTAVNSSTKLPVTDLNKAVQGGADSNLHWYKLKKMKGGMKFTISGNEQICYKSIGTLDCALNSIDTITGLKLHEIFKNRVFGEHPKNFSEDGIGMYLKSLIEILKQIIPKNFEGKTLYYRTIPFNTSDTLFSILTKYLEIINSNPETKLNEREGLLLEFLVHNDIGHFVVLAQINDLPYIIDQQDSENPVPLHEYSENYSHYFDAIIIVEDQIYNSISYPDSTSKLYDQDNDIGRIPSQLTSDDINVQDSDGNTVLINAIINNNTSLIISLLEDGADQNIHNNIGLTPLHIACKENNEYIVNILLDAQADVNGVNNKGQTPLFWACGKGNEAIVNMLIDKHANVNIMDMYRDTPLIWACANGNENIVKILLNANADVNITNIDNNTPLHMAYKNGNENIVRMLIDAHADINVKNIKGETPSDCAKVVSQKDTITTTNDEPKWISEEWDGGKKLKTRKNKKGKRKTRKNKKGKK